MAYGHGRKLVLRFEGWTPDGPLPEATIQRIEALAVELRASVVVAQTEEYLRREWMVAPMFPTERPSSSD